MSNAVRLRSDEFACSDRLDALQGVYAAVERVDIDVDRIGPLYFDLHTRQFNDIGLVAATVSAMSPHRTAAQARDGKDDVVLAFILEGAVRFSPYGADELDLRPGEAYLGFNTRASRHDLTAGSRFFDITIPREVIAPLVTDLDNLASGKLVAGPAMTLLRTYAQALLEQPGELDPQLAAISANHILDLSVLALGAHKDAGERAKARGLRHARLMAIKADMAKYCGQSWLTLDAMARRHQISPQYLRALFYKDGTSFSDFLRSMRLGLAHRLLTDPDQAHLRISDIAFLSGFGDLSHFNKVFRRHYNRSPSDVRADAGAPQ